MKKVLLGFVVIAGMSLFNSCTDNTLEEIENREQKILLIDKNEIGDEDEEQQQGGD